jgi:thiamine biosynthesis lipoprotein
MKNKLGRIAAALLAAALLLAFVPGCVNDQKRSDVIYDCFDTVLTFTAFTTDSRAFDEAKKVFEEGFRRYHRLFDIYNEYEGEVNLAKVNDLAGETVKVPHEIAELLELGIECERLTNGRVNIALGAVISLWHGCREDAERDKAGARIPSDEELREAAKHCDIARLRVDTANDTVLIEDPLMRLDVGAIAKGFAADKVGEELKRFGFAFMLNCGGAVLASGNKPDGSPWVAGIDMPDSEGFAASVPVVDSALSSSGNYIRYFTVDGVNYGHIIDPDTLYPANIGAETVSVSVSYGSGYCAAYADALSTACYILDADKGLELISGIEGAEALFILKTGELRRSEGFPGE